MLGFSVFEEAGDYVGADCGNSVRLYSDRRERHTQEKKAQTSKH